MGRETGLYLTLKLADHHLGFITQPELIRVVLATVVK